MYYICHRFLYKSLFFLFIIGLTCATNDTCLLFFIIYKYIYKKNDRSEYLWDGINEWTQKCKRTDNYKSNL